ncbi:MAG: hypothetical protein K2I28_01220 [Muribaculaceae bacterium]|nr:hypothetical protein [Muribaculaceae bacterium]
MKTKFITLLCGGATLMMMTSCASIFTKKGQDVTFKGIPGTTVYDKDKNRMIAHIGDNGFGEARINRQLKSKNLMATKEDYVTGYYTMGVKIQPCFWLNILWGGIPGMAIDAATGKMMKYEDKMIDVTLTPEETTAPVLTHAPEVKEIVSRNTPGTTSMEQTIVRWYFDSDPRGARIFYRVISNAPAEVKNTNETYMTTTPLEETKSFNIPGLTYENSRNVTIEIKVTKRGFEDQVKRFNVRQALDQQEISSFFELVPKE